MQRKIAKRLAKIADRQVLFQGTHRTWFRSLSRIELTEGLYELASEVKGVDSLHGEEILQTFFTAEAVSLLLTMPNLYWFWYIVKQTLVRASSVAKDDSPIEETVVRATMRQVRLTDKNEWDLLSPEAAGSPNGYFWLTRMARGIVVVTISGVMVPNPIFEPESN
jgi:hypothetical protein